MTSFLCNLEQNGACMSLLKIADRNRMFSPLRIEVKLIENFNTPSEPMCIPCQLHANCMPTFTINTIIISQAQTEDTWNADWPLGLADDEHHFSKRPEYA